MIIVENWIKMKTLSKKKKRIFILSVHIKGNKNIFRVLNSVCFFQSVALHNHTFALMMKETRPPPASQSSYFSGQLWGGSVLKASRREIPLLSLETLWFVEQQRWSIHQCAESLLKDNAHAEGGRTNGQEALRAPLATGGGGGRSQAINKKYF